MTEIETELSLMLLKLCEETLPKSSLAREEKFSAALTKVRHHLKALHSKSGAAK